MAGLGGQFAARGIGIRGATGTDPSACHRQQLRAQGCLVPFTCLSL